MTLMAHFSGGVLGFMPGDLPEDFQGFPKQALLFRTSFMYREARGGVFVCLFFVVVFYLQLNSDADALGLYKPNLLPLNSLPNETASVYQSKNVYRPLAKVIEQLMGLSNG